MSKGVWRKWPQDPPENDIRYLAVHSRDDEGNEIIKIGHYSHKLGILTADFMGNGQIHWMEFPYIPYDQVDFLMNDVIERDAEEFFVRSISRPVQ